VSSPSTGGALTPKSKPFGRAANFRLAVDFRTDWVPSPSAGGDEENRKNGLRQFIGIVSDALKVA